MQSKSYQELIHHLSRLEGQLASIKRELQQDKPNCSKASNTLAAASRSFASLRREFLRCFLDHYATVPKSKTVLSSLNSLMRIVSS